jgi:hypothetical protein
MIIVLENWIGFAYSYRHNDLRDNLIIIANLLAPLAAEIPTTTGERK